MSELKPALLFEFQHHIFLSVLKLYDPTSTPAVQQTLAEAVLVEPLEDVLVLNVSEYLDDPFEAFVDVALRETLEILLELIVEIVYETHGGSLAVLVEEALEGRLHRQVYISIFCKTTLVDVHHLLSQVDHVAHELVMLKLFVSHQFRAL